MSELRTNMLIGAPYYGMNTFVSEAELALKGKHVHEATLAAHEALYTGYQNGDPRVIVLDDPDSDLTGQYLTFDAEGPCYGSWDRRNTATDIGLRGANPGFEGILNPTTVVHADQQALSDYSRRGAPPELLEALDAVAVFNRFIVKEVAMPYLEQVAEAFGKDPAEYLAKFFPDGERWHTITRAILYQRYAPVGMRPIGSDGTELLIKEHHDKSSYTIDALQSSSGLQQMVEGEWRDAGTEITCFRGAADDELTEDGRGSLTPPTLHRAVVQEGLWTASPDLLQRGISRIALPTFICLSHADARRVQANSADTHPTERS